MGGFEAEGVEVGKVRGECQRKPNYCGSEAVDEIGA